MPKTLADGRIKLVALAVDPANPGAITVTEANAGTDLSCRILKSDYRLSPVASDTIADAELCSEGNATAFGASNYEGTVTPFRYLDEDGKTEVANDVAWELLKEKGTHLYFIEREGPHYTEPFAAGDEIEVYEIITDNPQKPSDRAGFIKRVVPLGVQRAWLNKLVVADTP